MANLLKIKELANEKNIAIKDLAAGAGLTPQALSRLMRLGSTNTETLERIAQILCVSPAVFFDAPAEISETQTSSCASSITGHDIKDNRLNDSRVLEKALDEISGQRQLAENALAELSKSQQQITELLALLKMKM